MVAAGGAVGWWIAAATITHTPRSTGTPIHPLPIYPAFLFAGAAVVALLLALAAINDRWPHRSRRVQESVQQRAERVLRVANRIRSRSPKIWRRPPYVLGSPFGVDTSAAKTIDRYEHDGIRRFFRIRLPYTRRFHARVVVPMLEELGTGTEDEGRFKLYVPDRPRDSGCEQLALALSYRASKILNPKQPPAPVAIVKTGLLVATWVCGVYSFVVLNNIAVVISHFA